MIVEAELSLRLSESVGMICRYTEFKPALIFQATGMSPDLQQVWRRRGQLPWGHEQPRAITVVEVAEIFVRYQLSLSGLPPSESSDVGKASAPAICWHALVEVDGACVVRGSPSNVESLLSRFVNEDTIFSELAGLQGKTAPRFLYRYNGSGPFHLGFDYPEAFEDSLNPTLTVINLRAIGVLLATNAASPLITVEVGDPMVPRAEWITKPATG